MEIKIKELEIEKQKVVEQKELEIIELKKDFDNKKKEGL